MPNRLFVCHGLLPCFACGTGQSLERKRTNLCECVVARHTNKMMRDGRTLLVSRDSHATVLFDPNGGGDFTRTTGAISERRAIGRVDGPDQRVGGDSSRSGNSAFPSGIVFFRSSLVTTRQPGKAMLALVDVAPVCPLPTVLTVPT